jgi:hypothetical protein
MEPWIRRVVLALDGGTQHRLRQVDADDVPSLLRQGDSITSRPAADVQAATGRPLAFVLGEAQQVLVGRRPGEPGDGFRAAPGRVGERIHRRYGTRS